jgi:hypothetical protein
MIVELKKGAPPDVIVGKSFTLQELRALFLENEFQKAVAEMKTSSDAEWVVKLGNEILEEMVREGNWKRE